MKAKEFFQKYLNEDQDKSPEWRLLNIMRLMILEVQEIAKTRNAKRDEALISIINEQVLKSKAFIKMINETEYFKSQPINEDLLKKYIKNESPILYQLVFEKLVYPLGPNLKDIAQK